MCIKDDALADAVREIEDQDPLPASDSRRLVRAAIKKQYSLPAVGRNHSSGFAPPCRSKIFASPRMDEPHEIALGFKRRRFLTPLHLRQQEYS